MEDANQQTFVVGQIETADALDKLDDIAAVPGLDVLFVGPADLGLRLGEGGDLDAAVQAVADAASRHGKAWGIAGGTPEQLSRYRQMGAQMLIAAGDFALVKVLEEGSKVLDETVE
jgi:2-keto-3-deoxy-L-rhamnonate aldolase RhmA